MQLSFVQINTHKIMMTSGPFRTQTNKKSKGHKKHSFLIGQKWFTDNNKTSLGSTSPMNKHFPSRLIQALDQHKNFPSRLHAMLEHVSESEHSSAVHWTHDGLAFVVIQQDVLVEHVLPIFFNQTKFRSFVSPSGILASVPSSS